jgi:hypothetical protein
MSVLSAMAGRPGRSRLNRLMNSAAICEASVALPPLPNSISLFPALKASAIAFDASRILSIFFSSANLPFTRMLSSNIFAIFSLTNQGLCQCNK